MRNELVKKLLAVVLSLVVGVTFIPLLGDSVSAADESEGLPTDQAVAGQEDVTVESPVADEEGNAEDAENAENADTAAPGDAESEVDPTQPAEDELVTVEEQDGMDVAEESAEATEPEGAKEEAFVSAFGNAEGVTLMSNPTDAELYSFSAVRSGNALFVNAYFKDHPWYAENGLNKGMFRFNGIYIDGYRVGNDFSSNSLSNYQVNLSSNLSPGYHTVQTVITCTGLTSTVNSYSSTYRVGIVSKPSSKGSFELYNRYASYSAPMDPNLVNYYMFLEYRSSKSKTWSAAKGPMNYYTAYKITKLRPNTWYKFRLYYGYMRNGEWFTGKQENQMLYTGWFKTGKAKKPAVKSVTVKAYNVKKKKQRIYGYYTGLYLGKRTYYKYKIKITVTLKKKPGSKGIWINGKKFKGNKKKYVIKLGPYTNYSKPKGKKFTVAIYTYHNKRYGGYSPMYKTKRKVK